MKKIFTSIAVIFLWCGVTNLYAYTIDVAKSYVAIQTSAYSGKFIGANGTVPSVMSADITDVSQRLSFELVSTNVYRIKNCQIRKGSSKSNSQIKFIFYKLFY